MQNFFQNDKINTPAPDMGDAAKNVEQVVNQYAGKSEGELISTLQGMVNNERAAGRLDAARIETIKKTLLPMMDEAQRKRMEELLRLLT